MTTKSRTGALAAIGAFGVVSLAMLTAHAQSSLVPVFTDCSSSGQLCTPIVTMGVVTGGLLEASYFPSVHQCSSVRAHFLVDGVELAVTPFLDPGQGSTTYSLGPVSPGEHTLGMQGEGRVGHVVAPGCPDNVGTLFEWGGLVRITVSALPPPAAIPAPGLAITALALLLAAYGVFRRRGA